MAGQSPDTKFLLAVKAFDFAKEVVHYATYCFIAWCIYLISGELSGKITEATVFFGYFTSSEKDYGIPWVMTVLAMGYAEFERRLRKRKTEYFQSRIRDLETRIHSGRTSSGLLPNGDTHPEDVEL